jgi:hypothetical protein
MECCDLADASGARATTARVDGCTFKGGGYGSQSGWKNNFNVEAALDVRVTNSTFYRSSGTYGSVFQVTDSGGKSYDGSPGAYVNGCTFDLDYDNGIEFETACRPIILQGWDNVFTGNLVKCHDAGTYPLVTCDVLLGASTQQNVVTGNTFDKASRGNIGELHGATNNTLSPNTDI